LSDSFSDISPQGLSDTLNVKNRAAIESLTSFIPINSATILKFQPEKESDKRPFNDFVAYLKGKNRAGIAAVGNCNVYFIPQDCLATEIGASKDSLLGVVVVQKKPQTASLNNILQQIIQKPT